MRRRRAGWVWRSSLYLLQLRTPPRRARSTLHHKGGSRRACRCTRSRSLEVTVERGRRRRYDGTATSLPSDCGRGPARVNESRRPSYGRSAVVSRCECYLTSSRCAFARLVFSLCFSRASSRFRRTWAARDFKGRPGWSSRRGMVGWSTGQPCFEGGLRPLVIETPRMRSPFARLTPGVRRILNQSRLSSSARAAVMMRTMGTRRMAALCWGAALGRLG